MLTGPEPLVYTQDDSFVLAVGEPLSLTCVSRILIGKWDALCAEALRRACGQAFPETPVEICRAGNDLLQALRGRPADFVVLGLTFADLDGIEIVDVIGRERLTRRLVIVSGRKDEHSLQTLRTARFDGFFDPLEETAERLAAALEQVAAGHGYLSPGLSRQMITHRSGGMLAQRLSATEQQVLATIGDGTDDQEAADRLGLSLATVRTHRRNIMRKLDVPTSAKLVCEAIRLGIVRIKPDGEVVRPRLADSRARRAVRDETARPGRD